MSPQFWKMILEAAKYMMKKEFWKLLNPWNLKKTFLISNTITGVEEYMHTVELQKGYQTKERYIDRCFKSFEKLRMYFS